MEEQSGGSRRTRSQAAPDWTVQESLILINEIAAVESEWGGTLPSFQKWQQIVENCNALEVNRNLNQCKRKWDSLLSEYKRVKNEGDGVVNGSLDIEVFRAIDRCIKAKGKKTDSHCTAEDEAQAVAEMQSVMDTDPDTDPEAQGPPITFFSETVSRKQGRRMKRHKRKIQRLNPWGYSTSGKIMLEESSRNEKMKFTSVNEESNVETKEETLAKILRENAMQINAILEGNLEDGMDYRLADLKNPDAIQIDFARRQGDNLIDCFGKISETLSLFCDLVRQ